MIDLISFTFSFFFFFFRWVQLTEAHAGIESATLVFLSPHPLFLTLLREELYLQNVNSSVHNVTHLWGECLGKKSLKGAVNHEAALLQKQHSTNIH